MTKASSNRPKASAFAAAMNLLSRREHGYIELVNKLMAKGHPEKEVTLALDRLKKNSLQSDSRFCEAFIRSSIGRGHGPIRIKQALYQRGIDALLIDDCLENDEAFWQQQAMQVWRKKFKKLSQIPADRQKQQRFLMYRGFTHYTIQTMFDELTLLHHQRNR